MQRLLWNHVISGVELTRHQRNAARFNDLAQKCVEPLRRHRSLFSRRSVLRLAAGVAFARVDLSASSHAVTCIN